MDPPPSTGNLDFFNPCLTDEDDGWYNSSPRKLDMPSRFASPISCATRRTAIGALCLTALVSLTQMRAATLNVVSYGAVPNDGGDDRAAIQNAINASSAGDTVYFPGGTYRLSGAIYPKSGIRLAGTNTTGSVLLYVGGSLSEIIGIGSVANVTVSYLTLDGNSSTAVKDGILASGASGLRLENLIIRNFGNASEGPRGIRFDPDVTDSIIASNRIENIGTGTAWGAGIRLSWRSSRNRVTDNVIAHTGRGGIFCNDDSTDNAILRNVVTGSGGEGLGIEVWGRCLRSLIEDNRIDHWLSVCCGSDFTVARRNTVSDKSGLYKLCGLEFVDSRYGVFADNLVDGGAQLGISISGEGAKEYVLWIRNTVQACGSLGAQLMGQAGGCRYQYFCQNKFLTANGVQPPALYPNMGDGFRFNGNCYYVSLDGNQIANNDHDGIVSFGDVNQVSFTGNSIQNNGNGGVWDGFGGDLEWAGNIVAGNRGGGGGAAWNTQPASRGFTNRKPVAAFTSPSVVVSGQTVTFTNTSSDPDGSTGQVLWDFGGGLPSTLASPSFTYTQAGTYLVSLIVWDNLGRGARVEKTVVVLPALGPNAPRQQDSGPDGLLVLEAENFDRTVPSLATPLIGAMSWQLRTNPPGYLGAGAMSPLPDVIKTNLDTETAMQNSPRMDYKVRFSRTGTHYIWVRGYGKDTGSDSVHVGLDGQFLNTPITAFPPSAPAVYNWSRTTTAGGNATMLPSVGYHFITVWMRENGFVADRLLFTSNPNYVPTGAGPSGSPAGLSASYWRFEEASGQALDVDGAPPYAGTLLGAASRSNAVFGALVPWTGAPNTKSMNFTGVDGDAVDMGTTGLDVGTGDFTLQGWINVRSFPGAATFSFIAGKRNSGLFADKGYELDAIKSGAGFKVRALIRAGGPALFADSGALNFNQWYHVAAVRGGGTLRVYVDGVLAKSVADTLAGEDLTSSQHLSVGGSKEGDGNFHSPFDGLIDEVRLTLAALPTNQFLNAVQSAPAVSITRTGNQVALAWAATGFVLQENENVTNSAGWTNLPNGGASPVIVPIEAGQKFFRLIGP